MEPSEDRLTDAERTAREVLRQDRRMVDRVAERGVHTLRDRWATEGLGGTSQRVESHPLSAYTLPSHARKILAPGALTELEAIFGDIKAANDELVGLDETVGGLLLANDDDVLAMRIRLRRWAESYVAARLAKPSPRDGGSQVARFRRLYYELLPALEEIGTRAGSVHYAFMGELLDYIPWLLFQGTWADMFETERSSSLHGRWRVVAPPENQNFCMEFARLYAWPSHDDVRRVVRVLRGRGGAATTATADARERLAVLAAEIREVRPFIIGDHNPERCATEVVPGLVASWFWGGAQQLGIVALHDDPRRRVAEFRALAFETSVRVRHDGVLASEFAPWIDVDAILETEPDALAANVAIVEAVHARLLDVFAKVDLAAAYGRVREAAAGVAGDVVPTQEAVAATFAVAEPEVARDAESPAPAEPIAPKMRVPSLRLARFLAILERLGCEVRQGKGSEVVAYRPGGRIARIGRHTRNREVPSTLVQRVLHLVGVTLGEWVRALEG